MEFKPCSVEAFAANIANRVRCVAQIKSVRQALSVSLQVTTVCWPRVQMSTIRHLQVFQTFLSVSNCKRQHSLIGQPVWFLKLQVSCGLLLALSQQYRCMAIGHNAQVCFDQHSQWYGFILAVLSCWSDDFFEMVSIIRVVLCTIISLGFRVVVIVWQCNLSGSMHFQHVQYMFSQSQYCQM